MGTVKSANKPWAFLSILGKPVKGGKAVMVFFLLFSMNVFKTLLTVSVNKEVLKKKSRK